MFKITKKDKRSELDKEIDNLLKTMNEMEDPTSDSYKILSERVETLCQARSSYVKDDRKINPNTVLTVAGSLAGILLIVVVENKDLIIRSKALPFVLKGEEDYYERISNVANLILEIELPQLCGVDVSNIRKLKSLLAVLASEYPMQIDMMKLSAMAGMSRTTLLAYLQYLHRAKLINLLYSGDASLKKMQRPDKIYMENSNLLHALSLNGVNEGTQREVFFVNQLVYQHRVEYASSQADFLVDGKYTFEVGGKSKDGKQIANMSNSYIAADGIEFPYGNKIPLWCFGFLY